MPRKNKHAHEKNVKLGVHIGTGLGRESSTRTHDAGVDVPAQLHAIRKLLADAADHGQQ